jgi:RNA polymerase sigma-70 factor (ECF subfamily)
MEPELETAVLQDLVVKHQNGDRAALNTLILRSRQRLEGLAKSMLGDFPAVRAREETDDVLQNALLRLTRSLESVMPASVRDYYRLAAGEVQQLSSDVLRRHRRRPADPLGSDEPAATAPADLERWAALQQAVEKLPAEEREVFGLTFYHGWSQAQIAELLQISDRQVRRLWADTCARLGAAIKDSSSV